MTHEEQLKLYNAAKEAYSDTYKLKLEKYEQAKEAYYNGEEIMSDIEFDTLEKELGLENKSYVGARHNPSYTVRHPFVMGSLSKVQIHEKNGMVDWYKHYKEVSGFVNKFSVNPPLIVTPKYDGCSFELYVNGSKVTISTRGDGKFGRDIYKHIIGKIPVSLLSLNYSEYVLRGEVLIKKSVFENKYADQFTNPRSFVAGVLGRDYSDSNEFNQLLNDLDVVIYDYRINDSDEWVDNDWTELTHLSNVKKVLPEFYVTTTLYTFGDEYELASLYWKFDEHRKNSEYALDGFVIKPVASVRKLNLTEARPKDCVAIKFIPMLEETEVINITWNLGKTGEYIPIIWVNPVEMDGRMVQKCSGHNYGLLIQQGVGIGSKIIMSLAGDIIPFLYKVTSTHIPVNIPMPEKYTIDGVHLMAILDENDTKRNAFVNSAASLNIPNLGNEIASKVFDSFIAEDKETDEFFGETTEKHIPSNILECTPEELFFAVKNLSKNKAEGNAKKIMNEFKKVLETLTLKEIIRSFNFKFCGDKVAEQVTNYLLGLDYDFASMASEGYQWATNKESDNYKKLVELLKKLGKEIDDFKQHAVETKNADADKIPVILTGEPNNYKSKGEFIQHNPQYRVTGSWKEVKIVFTNDLESNTGKMKKAREKGIEIRVY